MERMLTVDDVARIMAVKRRTAYEVMKRFPHLESPFRCTESALRAYILENTVYPEEKPKTKNPRVRVVTTQAVDYRIPRRRETG